MQIYIDNKLAALKQGTSFDYISENRLFGGSDGFSLTISLPLKGCPQNQDIFGHINRSDVSVGKAILDCEIRGRNMRKFGCVTITEISEVEVKVQFLEGRSEQNFKKTLDKYYINELDLGAHGAYRLENLTPTQAWDAHGNDVALPWVNESTGNIQNCAEYKNNTFVWNSNTRGLSWQPYLLFIAKQICRAVEYTFDFSAWEAHDTYKYIIICNALPHAWYMPQYARALPHWTVEEFFTKLELFLGGEFDFDHRAKHISFNFTKDIIQSKIPIKLDNVVEEHSRQVKVEDEKCEYVEAKNLAYKECDYNMWKYYSCDWFFKQHNSDITRFDTLTELLAEYRQFANWENRGRIESGTKSIHEVLYAADVDTYFIIRTISRTQTGSHGGLKIWLYKCVLKPINMLGARIVDTSDDALQDEIEFLPACIDFTDDVFGNCIFLSPGNFEDDGQPIKTRSGYEPFSNEWYAEQNSYFAKTLQDEILTAGEKSKSVEYYDRIYIAFWDGTYDSSNHLPAHPFVENIEISQDWNSYYQPHFSIRLNEIQSQRFNIAPKIDAKQKVSFKFIADAIPDVRSIFIIKGKRYVCEKLTATFTENGMSQLIKGDFYPVAE